MHSERIGVHGWKMKTKMYDKYSLGLKSTTVMKMLSFLSLTFGWKDISMQGAKQILMTEKSTDLGYDPYFP